MKYFNKYKHLISDDRISEETDHLLLAILPHGKSLLSPVSRLFGCKVFLSGFDSILFSQNKGQN